MCDYRAAPHGAAAHPTDEHYLPLLYTVGARLPEDGVRLFNDTLDGALTMTSVLYGDTGLLTGIA